MSEQPLDINEKNKELYELSDRMTNALNYGTLGECSKSK